MGSVSSLFTRLLGENPGENQLTEALASVCEHSDVFRARLLERLLGEPVHDVRVATQRPHYLDPREEPKFVDLEFWKPDGNGGRELTCFVEVKFRSGEHASCDSDGEKRVPQTQIYQRILWNGHERYGPTVGLFTLTPRWNRLEVVLEPEYRGRLREPCNLFWDDVGRLAQSVAASDADDTQRFICREFHEYLRRIGLMAELQVTVQDLAISAQYIGVKKKLWGALEPVAEFMKKAIVSKQEAPSYPMASRQEWENDRLCVWRYLNETTQLSVIVGFGFPTGGVPWIGAWIEAHPKCADVRRKVFEIYQRALDGDACKGEAYAADGRWHHNSDPDVWWICGHGSPVTDFLGHDTGVLEMSEYLKARLRDLLRNPDLRSLVHEDVRVDDSQT